MLEDISKDKFILINEAFHLKEYDSVIQESCKIFEVLMKKLYVEALGRFDSRSRKRLVDAEFSEHGAIDGIDTFSFGQIVGLYIKTDFFSIWGDQTGRDPALLKGINLQLINKLRNASAHKVKGQHTDLQGAEYVYSSLKLFLAILGYTEYEKYISLFLEPKNDSHKVSDLNEQHPTNQRTKNIYNVLDKRERRRLEFQLTLFRPKDVDVISRAVKGIPHYNILDIGCNDGSMICDRLKDVPSPGAIVGVDINEDIIRAADIENDLAPILIQSDCESPSFEEDVREVMSSNSIEGFDLAVLSMVLLHLNKPFKAIKAVRKFLKRKAQVFIRDMDDGLSIACPDPKGIVSRMLDISYRINGTAYRHSGREIYSLLRRSGFKNINVHNEVIDTADMSFEERELLFITNFSFVRGCLIRAAKAHPEKYNEELNWFLDAYDELEQLFQSEDFYYRMGTMVFTASKG